MFKSFGGRILQVAEALCYRDGVTNQIVNMHQLFLDMGLDAHISAISADPRCGISFIPLDDLIASTADIIFFHHSGYATCLEKVLRQRCCKVYVFHNITPPNFFEIDSCLFQLCKQGLEQFPKIKGQFDYYIAASRFNLSSLIELGISENQTLLFSYIVNKQVISSPVKEINGHKTWLFVGRFVENKQQLQLIKLFHQFISNYENTHELILVGNNTQNPDYTDKVLQLISQLKLDKKIRILGSVSDDELNAIYAQADIYVSMSQHEGFGLPLIEACYNNLPVFALNSSAINEVLQESEGIADNDEKLLVKILEFFRNPAFKEQMLAHQDKLKNYYDVQQVRARMQLILERIIPKPGQFKTVSIIICTYNRADYLERCLNYLQYQTNPNFEVIIVNGPSTDHTEEIINRYKESTKVVYNTEKNLSISRNMGITLAQGDIIAFIDDDAIPFDNWVDIILTTYNHIPLRIAALGGPAYYAGTLYFQVEAESTNTFCDIKPSYSNSDFFDSSRFRTLVGTNSTFKREELIAIGGFDEQYDYFLDETDVCLRLQIDTNKLIDFQHNLYLRHEFAQSNNRISKHNYNWFSICKNTAYFIIKFNPTLSESECFEIIEEHIHRIYYSRVKNAYSNREISYQEMYQYIITIYQGVNQGIDDAKKPRKITPLLEQSVSFKAYDKINNEFQRNHTSLHIVILTDEFGHFTHAGGIGTLYYQLASELLQMGHKISVIIPSTDEELTHIKGNFALYKVKTQSLIVHENHSVFIGNLNKAIDLTRFIQKLHTDYPIDVIDYALWNTLGLTLSLSSSLNSVVTVLRLVTPFKVAAKINGWQLSEDEMQLMIKAEEYAIQKASVIIPISHSIEKTMTSEYQLIKDNRWTLCNPGIAYWPTFDVNSGYNTLAIQHSKLVSISESTKKMVFIGRLETRKGIQTLLTAAQLFFERQPNADAVFIIAGKDLENIEEKFLQTATQVAKDKIIFLGEIENFVKEKLYSFSDIVVFPSLYESFGLVSLEAFVHGKPVIGANAGAIPEVVQDHKNGLLFEPENAEDLVNKIQRLLADKDLYASLSKGALLRIRELSARNMAINSYHIYRDALNKKITVNEIH